MGWFLYGWLWWWGRALGDGVCDGVEGFYCCSVGFMGMVLRVYWGVLGVMIYRTFLGLCCTLLLAMIT